MTLYELFTQRGIQRPADLVQRVPGMTRQYAYLLWHGKRELSRRMARKLAAALDIPLVELLAAEPVDPPVKPPSGRPRKHPKTGEA
jgi:transcriptional regulator with XRE-family HTH domain